MSKKAFDKIMEGLNEALAFARGELKGAKLHVPPGAGLHSGRAYLPIRGITTHLATPRKRPLVR
jgi:hypothetical protein